MKPLAIVLGTLAFAAAVPLASGQELPPGHPPLDQASGKVAPPLPAEAPAPPQLSEQELLKQLDAAKGLKEQDKPFEVAAALGKLYYGRTRFQEAADYLDQAVKAAEPIRTLYLEQRARAAAGKKPVPAPGSVGCAREAQTKLATLNAAARAKAKAGDAAAAAACAREAIEPLREVLSMLANSRYLVGDAGAALVARDRQLEVFEGDAEALYARGAMALDTRGDNMNALARASDDLTRLLKENPAGPRAASATLLLRRVEGAIAAGGLSQLVRSEAQSRKAAGGPGDGGAITR